MSSDSESGYPALERLILRDALPSMRFGVQLIVSFSLLSCVASGSLLVFFRLLANSQHEDLFSEKSLSIAERIRFYPVPFSVIVLFMFMGYASYRIWLRRLRRAVTKSGVEINVISSADDGTANDTGADDSGQGAEHDVDEKQSHFLPASQLDDDQLHLQMPRPLDEPLEIAEWDEDEKYGSSSPLKSAVGKTPRRFTCRYSPELVESVFGEQSTRKHLLRSTVHVWY